MGVWNAIHIFYAADRFFQFCQAALKHQRFLLAHILKRAGCGDTSISFNFLIEAFRVLKLVNIPPNQRILIYGMPARAASNAMASRAPRLAPTNRIVPRPAEIRRAYCSASRYIGSVFSRLIIWI